MRSCGCGRPLELHYRDVKNEYEKKSNNNNVKENKATLEEWDHKKHTCEDGPADHGVLSFVDSKRYLAKYIRVHFDTDPRKLRSTVLSFKPPPPTRIPVSFASPVSPTPTTFDLTGVGNATLSLKGIGVPVLLGS